MSNPPPLRPPLPRQRTVPPGAAQTAARRPARGRRGLRPWVAAAIVCGLLVVLATAWTGFWYQTVTQAERQITAWRDREARLGRLYNCASQSLGGYPFSIEVRCANPSVELRNLAPAVAARAKDLVVTAGIHDTTLLTSELTGPLTMGELGRAPSMVASWTLARSSVHGSPYAPDRLSAVLEQATLDRMTPAGKETVVRADRMELDGRIVGGSATDNPVIDAVLRFSAGIAPNLHPLAAQATDVELRATLRGLKDFTPKPWKDRFRELQAAGGRIDIVSLRAQQGEAVAVTSGSLGITPKGGLEGELRLTVAGLERLMPALGVNPNVASDRLAPALSALERFSPGLGAIVRERAPNLAASMGLGGEQAQLEGKPAVTLPLRFNDGAVSLGPLPLGQLRPLF